MEQNKLETKSLRIGNWINYITAEGDMMPRKIKWEDFKWAHDDIVLFHMVNYPIELTEEILLKCGLKWKYGFYYVTDEIRICSDTYNVYAEQDNNIMLWIGIECKHLHQLQNLYFALTGQELEIKL